MAKKKIWYQSYYAAKLREIVLQLHFQIVLGTQKKTDNDQTQRLQKLKTKIV